MDNSYLIQRLKRPFKPKSTNPNLPNSDEIFGFGGGKPRGGLSKEAFDFFKSLWSWDYMGSAEFEYGAVPKALEAIRSAKDLKAWSIEVPYLYDSGHGKTRTTLRGVSTVYFLCPEKYRELAEIIVKHHATNQYPKPDFSTKESVMLAGALAGEDNYPIGWLELNHGYFFFADQETWKNTCEAFGVEAS